METRKILYYKNAERQPKHYNGAPIFHFSFIDVRTGEIVTLGQCFFNEEVSKVLGAHYYQDITDAAADFDILWALSEEKISPVTVSFDDVKKEYQSRLAKGVKEEEMFTSLVTFCEEQRKKKQI